MNLLFSIIEFKDEYISSKLFPSHIKPVFSLLIASDAPPSFPPREGTPYCAASMVQIL